MDLTEMLNRLSYEFAALPRWARVSIFAALGGFLTRMAVPLFEDELMMALIYMVLAVFFFWMAIAPFM